MLLIIFAKYEKNLFRTAGDWQWVIARWTQQGFITKSCPTKWPWKYTSMSKVITHDTSSLTSLVSDYLCQVWKASIPIMHHAIWLLSLLKAVKAEDGNIYKYFFNKPSAWKMFQVPLPTVWCAYHNTACYIHVNGTSFSQNPPHMDVNTKLGNVNSLRPRAVLRGSPEHLKRKRVILTHICVTREMRAIFRDAYMRHQASMS